MILIFKPSIYNFHSNINGLVIQTFEALKIETLNENCKLIIKDSSSLFIVCEAVS